MYFLSRIIQLKSLKVLRLSIVVPISNDLYEDERWNTKLICLLIGPGGSVGRKRTNHLVQIVRMESGTTQSRWKAQDNGGDLHSWHPLPYNGFPHTVSVANTVLITPLHFHTFSDLSSPSIVKYTINHIREIVYLRIIYINY